VFQPTLLLFAAGEERVIRLSLRLVQSMSASSNPGACAGRRAFAFSPDVGALCAKHPEVGPCQYECNACRRSGGRVCFAGGVEITLQMEAEYDRKVMRVLIK
jgi:hypothetical protein